MRELCKIKEQKVSIEAMKRNKCLYQSRILRSDFVSFLISIWSYIVLGRVHGCLHPFPLSCRMYSGKMPRKNRLRTIPTLEDSHNLQDPHSFIHVNYRLICGSPSVHEIILQRIIDFVQIFNIWVINKVERDSSIFIACLDQLLNENWTTSREWEAWSFRWSFKAHKRH